LCRLKRIISYFSLTLLAFIIVLCSCENSTSESAIYYPFDSLVEQQIRFLMERNVLVTKVATLDNEESRISFTPPDSSAWLKELGIFQRLNIINKPINKGGYDVEDGLRDSKSNLKIKLFRSKTDLPVEYLKIYYKNSLNNIHRIESKYKEDNSMYAGTRYLVMEFEDVNGTMILHSYAIEGGQKMLLGDTVTYRVNTSISFVNN
jgi:hypothetical protein